MHPSSIVGHVDGRYEAMFKDIFVDFKFTDGSNEAKKLLRALRKEISQVRYVTFAATMGSKMLREYAEISREFEIEPIAFTIHTHIPEYDVRDISGHSLTAAVYKLGSIAVDAGFHAIVLEGKLLENEKIRSLPIKKLVTGIRIDSDDPGEQARVTKLDDLAKVKDAVDYVVISSRYLNDPVALERHVSMLRS